MLMFRSTHDRILETVVNYNAEINALLRSQVSERDDRIDDLREELAQAKAKIERMEIAFLPMSSAAGASYAAELRHDKRQAPPSAKADPNSLSWDQQLRNFMMETDRADVERAKAQKEFENGVPSK